MLKIITFLVAVLFFYFILCYWLNELFYHFNRQVYTRLWWTTGISLLGSLILMGLPGVLILGMTEPVIKFIWGIDDLGDSAWPLGAIISLILPALIMPVYFLSFYKIQATNFIQIMIFTSLLIFAGVLTSVAAYFFLGKHV